MARLLAISVLCCWSAQWAFADGEAIKVSVWAVKASGADSGEKKFGRGLEAVLPVLKRLSFDTFELVKSYSGEDLGFGKDKVLQINGEYSLQITPLSREEDGRVSTKVSVRMRPTEKDKDPVEALSATVLVKPGDKIKLEGLHLDKGELIIIFQMQ